MNNDQKIKDLQIFENDIKNVSSQLPNHKLKEFTFNSLEQHLLAEQQTIVALANQTQNTIINEICLKRIGVNPNPDIHIRYSIGLGRFVCFIPKSPKMNKTQNANSSPDKTSNSQ